MRPENTIEVELDRVRVARLSMFEMERFRRATVREDRPKGIDLASGSGMKSPEGKTFGDWTSADWIAAFWSILHRDDEDLTEDSVAMLVDGHAFIELQRAFIELLGTFFPEVEEDEEEGDADPPTPTT